MKKPKVLVGPSFAGAGVFSQDEFKRGDVIGEVFGRVIAGGGDNYSIELDDVHSLDPDAPFRFLNHSCSPNAQFFTDDRKRGKHLRMFVAALRKIRPGEELTIAYGWGASHAVRCLCGTKKCLGWVVDPKELHLVEPPKKTRSKPKLKSKSAGNRKSA